MSDDRGRFGGDMDRNEVEIDLNKFMELLQEKSTLKDRIILGLVFFQHSSHLKGYS